MPGTIAAVPLSRSPSPSSREVRRPAEHRRIASARLRPPDNTRACVPVRFPAIPPRVMSSQICLKWNSFLSNIATSFESLWEEEGLVDVTLASDGQCLTAHKVILSASSPFFKKVFQVSPPRPFRGRPPPGVPPPGDLSSPCCCRVPRRNEAFDSCRVALGTLLASRLEDCYRDYYRDKSNFVDRAGPLTVRTGSLIATISSLISIFVG